MKKLIMLELSYNEDLIFDLDNPKDALDLFSFLKKNFDVNETKVIEFSKMTDKKFKEQEKVQIEDL